VLSSRDGTVLLIADGESMWQVAGHQSLIEPVGGGAYTVEGDKQRLAQPVRRLLEEKLQELLDAGRIDTYRRMLGLRAQLLEGLPLDWHAVAPPGLASERRLDALEDFLHLFRYKRPLQPKRRDSLMLQASALGDVVVMQALLDARAPVDCREPRDVAVFLVVKGLQPVHTAAVRGHEAALELLLDRRADVNAFTASHDAPLTFAAISGHTAVMKKLLHQRADVSNRNAFGHNALDVAAIHGSLASVRGLLSLGFPTECNSEGVNSLHLCALMNSGLAIAQTLVAGRVDPHAVCRLRRFSLTWVFMAYFRLSHCLGDKTVISLLFRALQHSTPDVLAAVWGNDTVIQFLAGADGGDIIPDL